MNLALGIGRFNGGRLEGLELPYVEVLDNVGYRRY